MKWPKVLGVLLALNFGLLTALSVFVYTRMTSPAVAPVPLAAVEPAPEPEPVAQPPAPEIVTVTVTNDFRWRQLESEDYPEYIERLRSIGCPEQTIRDLVIADLDKLLAPKVQAIRRPRPTANYWESEEESLANETNPLEVAKQEKAVEVEKREAIQKLLGVDLVRERLKQKGVEDYYERRLSFLPEEKRASLRKVLDEYDERELAVREEAGEDGQALSAVVKQQVRELQSERQAQIEALLTPEERQQYDLWLSPTANNVRHDLYGMNATEEEFQAVFQARKSFNQTWANQDPNLLDPATRAQYEKDEAAMKNQLREKLGDQRYAQFLRGADDEFHHINATITRFNLPRERAIQVYELKATSQSMRAAVMQDASLPPERKEQVLKAMADETERSVRELLGEKALGYYARRGQTAWFRP